MSTAEEGRSVILCSQCHRPIVSGQLFGFAYFKIPGKKIARFFHRRFSGGEDETRSRKDKATLNIRLRR
jgi:hypothetical protein